MQYHYLSVAICGEKGGDEDEKSCYALDRKFDEYFRKVMQVGNPGEAKY